MDKPMRVGMVLGEGEDLMERREDMSEKMKTKKEIMDCIENPNISLGRVVMLGVEAVVDIRDELLKVTKKLKETDVED